ncbi:DUF6282 family protein [Streptomyces thinghirensis]|nr:DUF6282 family protein [Streptomyces thinghirensis]
MDVHYHAGPDLYRRRLTAAGAGRAYAQVGGWVVLKSHLAPTAACAWEARQEGLPVSGALVLNELAGGVRTRPMEQAVYAHGPDTPARLLVHLPTLVGPAPVRTAAHTLPPRARHRTVACRPGRGRGRATAARDDRSTARGPRPARRRGDRPLRSGGRPAHRGRGRTARCTAPPPHPRHTSHVGLHSGRP